jgi:hypothetical protein
MDRTTALILSALVSAGPRSCTSSSSEGLSPDLNISLECCQRLGPADEIKIETGLYSAGFDVLNRARIARDLRVEFAPTVSIDAIDPRGRIVTVDSFGEGVPSEQGNSPFYLNLSLVSRPPTSRDTALEKHLEKLAAEVSTCSAVKIERHSNTASLQWLYNDIAKRTRGWFEQAKQEAPASNARRVHERA